MEFIFADAAKVDLTSLRQGDLLEKSDELAEAVRAAHSYYAEADDYTHFLVLTQSCDLVKRDSKPPKSPYITLAAVRPLQKALDRRVTKYLAQGIEFPLRVCERNRRILLDQFLERLLHNTEDGLFFIRAGSAPTVIRDSCAFLPLSIALRNTHYDICLNNKVAQLEDIFAAKLGWMAGNQYSRIGTPDFEEHLPDANLYKKNFFDEVLHNNTAWLSPSQIKLLKEKIRTWNRENKDLQMTEEVARSMLSSIPGDFYLAISRAINLLVDKGIIDDNAAKISRATNILKSDPALKKLITSAD
ncbi:MAG: hypothetical protein C0605_03225 [Hyphomicrobiales bacterium]|nr:MAG: hypothetical protein C0605_03225 [Hyphomicrobiales bacterium]